MRETNVSCFSRWSRSTRENLYQLHVNLASAMMSTCSFLILLNNKHWAVKPYAEQWIGYEHRLVQIKEPQPSMQKRIHIRFETLLPLNITLLGSNYYTLWNFVGFIGTELLTSQITQKIISGCNVKKCCRADAWWLRFKTYGCYSNTFHLLRQNRTSFSLN